MERYRPRYVSESGGNTAHCPPEKQSRKRGQKAGSFRSKGHMIIKHRKNGTKHALRDYAVCHITVYYRAQTGCLEGWEERVECFKMWVTRPPYNPAVCYDHLY